MPVQTIETITDVPQEVTRTPDEDYTSDDPKVGTLYAFFVTWKNHDYKGIYKAKKENNPKLMAGQEATVEVKSIQSKAGKHIKYSFSVKSNAFGGEGKKFNPEINRRYALSKSIEIVETLYELFVKKNIVGSKSKITQENNTALINTIYKEIIGERFENNEKIYQYETDRSMVELRATAFEFVIRNDFMFESNSTKDVISNAKKFIHEMEQL